MSVDMTTQSIAVGDNWVKVGNDYVGSQPNGATSFGDAALLLTVPDGVTDGSRFTISTDGTNPFGTLDVSKTYSSVIELASLTDGQQVPALGLGGFSSETSGVRLAVFMEEGAKRRASLLSILAENDGDNNGAANSALVLDHGAGIPENTKILWSSVDRATAKSSGGVDGQWKVRRLGTADNITDNSSELVLFRTENDGGGNGLNYNARSADGDINHSAQSGGTITNNNMPAMDDTWRRIDQFIDTGTDATYDGSVRIVGHYPDLSAAPALLALVEFDGTAVWPDAVRVYGAGGVDRFRYFIFQNFFGNGDGAEPLKDFGAEVRHENIFIQVGSYKRFELCNNATYANATKNEIQPHDTWATGEVEGVIVKGSFSKGDTAWVHQIDENNASVASLEVIVQ